MAADPSYRVVWSQKVIAGLKELGIKASAVGKKPELRRQVRLLDERLRREPLAVGEVYRSRGLVHQHLAVQSFLAINFAVDAGRKLVLVKDCRVLSGHGL